MYLCPMFIKPQLAIQDFDYSLPDTKIAYRPASDRAGSKLLVWDEEIIAESIYAHIAEFIPTNATLVFNNSKVIAARILFDKSNATNISPAISDDNNTNEILEKKFETYKRMFDEWLLEQPMFISDIFKNEMRNLNYASRNNENSIQELNRFFSIGNEENVLKFLNYMRSRDLTFEKKKWNFNKN